MMIAGKIKRGNPIAVLGWRLKFCMPVNTGLEAWFGEVGVWCSLAVTPQMAVWNADVCASESQCKAAAGQGILGK